MISVAKPRYFAAIAREHGRCVLAPLLPTPIAKSASMFHTPCEELFEVRQRLFLLARIKGEVRLVQHCIRMTANVGKYEIHARRFHLYFQVIPR